MLTCSGIVVKKKKFTKAQNFIWEELRKSEENGQTKSIGNIYSNDFE